MEAEELQRELKERKLARQEVGEVVEEAVGRWAPAVNLEQRHKRNTSSAQGQPKLSEKIKSVCTRCAVVSEGRQLGKETGGSRGGKARPQIGAVRQIIRNARQVGQV